MPKSTPVLRCLLPGLALSLLACEGTVPKASPSTGGVPHGGGSAGLGGTGGGGGAAMASCTSDSDTSALPLRRLTSIEYQLTLQELFALGEPPDVSAVPKDGDQEGFRTIAALQSLSDQHLRAYGDIAVRLGQELLADAPRRTRVVGCELTTVDCLEDFVTRFGQLAYRRPLSDGERGDLLTRARAGSSDPEQHLLYVVEALLSSASFVFRVEVGQSREGASVAELGPLELAARLSFTVWGRGPSAELLSRAQQGELSTASGVEAIAGEMLADPRAAAFYESFFAQWLDFEELRRPNAPPAGWDDSLMPQMIDETARLLREFAWTPGFKLTDVLSANFTYVTAPLATFYGLPFPGGGTGSQKVTFPVGHPRENSGLLTHAALISAKSDADLISYRGKWLRGAFLCQKLEVPPGLLADVASELAGLTYVQVIEKRNTEPPCAACHALIDPLGVGFAQYDGSGHYDSTVQAADYGLTPRFEGAAKEEFESLAELATQLKQMPELASCLAEKAFIYTQGRFPGAEDECALAAIGERFAEREFSFPALINALVQSPSFRSRRAPP